VQPAAVRLGKSFPLIVLSSDRVPQQSILASSAVFAMIRAFLQHGGRLLRATFPPVIA
jgi:hypothetical protein